MIGSGNFLAGTVHAEKKLQLQHPASFEVYLFTLMQIFLPKGSVIIHLNTNICVQNILIKPFFCFMSQSSANKQSCGVYISTNY